MKKILQHIFDTIRYSLMGPDEELIDEQSDCITLQLRGDTKKSLKELMDMSEERSYARVIRHALVVYHTLMTCMQQGKTFVVRHEDGTEEPFNPATIGKVGEEGEE